MRTWSPNDPVRYEDKLITRSELSRWLAISASRLRVWQRLGIGPPALRPGGVRVMYKIGSVLVYLEGRSVAECPDVRQPKKQNAENLSVSV